jgi:protein CpxP
LVRLGFATLAVLSTLATAAVAQSSTTHKPADSPQTTGAVEPGANSFTEAQARSRLEAQGFGNVTELRKDDQGIWRGKAQKDGKSTSVAIDYKGTVQTQ